MPKIAAFVETEFSYQLLCPLDPEAFPIFESDDADDVLAFAWANGIEIHTLND